MSGYKIYVFFQNQSFWRAFQPFFRSKFCLFLRNRSELDCPYLEHREPRPKEPDWTYSKMKNLTSNIIGTTSSDWLSASQATCPGNLWTSLISSVREFLAALPQTPLSNRSNFLQIKISNFKNKNIWLELKILKLLLTGRFSHEWT